MAPSSVSKSTIRLVKTPKNSLYGRGSVGNYVKPNIIHNAETRSVKSMSMFGARQENDDYEPEFSAVCTIEIKSLIILIYKLKYITKDTISVCQQDKIPSATSCIVS